MNTSVPTLTTASLSDCDADQVLVNLDSVVPYEEFELSYNTVYGISSLVVWFVDPAIDPEANADEIEESATLAVRDAIALSHQLATTDNCVAELFTHVNPVVVDRNYNGWFSGLIPVPVLLETASAFDESLWAIERSIEGEYRRDISPLPFGPVPDSSCTWVETRERIQYHFDPARQNVSFYFVVEDNGEAKVWAQWDGAADAVSIAAMLNVARELDCLYPPADWMIVIIVDGAGNMQLLGRWPSEAFLSYDLDQFQVVYVQE